MYQHSTIHFCCWDSAGLFAFMTFRPLPFPWAPAVFPITWSTLGYCKYLRLPLFLMPAVPRVWSNPFSYLHPLYKDSGVVWFSDIILKGLNCWSRSRSVGIMMVISHSWSQSSETWENDEGPSALSSESSMFLFRPVSAYLLETSTIHKHQGLMTTRIFQWSTSCTWHTIAQRHSLTNFNM